MITLRIIEIGYGGCVGYQGVWVHVNCIANGRNYTQKWSKARPKVWRCLRWLRWERHLIRCCRDGHQVQVFMFNKRFSILWRYRKHCSWGPGAACRIGMQNPLCRAWAKRGFTFELGDLRAFGCVFFAKGCEAPNPVSYTHLTLPTKLEV